MIFYTIADKKQLSLNDFPRKINGSESAQTNLQVIYNVLSFWFRGGRHILGFLLVFRFPVLVPFPVTIFPVATGVAFLRHSRVLRANSDLGFLCDKNHKKNTKRG